MLYNAFKNIKCPHCGKSHFSVSEPGNYFEFAVLKIHPDPIYKDGILQNPEIYDPEPQTYHCTCQECGQKFWLTVEQKGKHTFNTIETEGQRDERLKNEWNNIFKSKKEVDEGIQEEVEKVAEITGAKIDDAKIEDMTGITNLEAGQGVLTYGSNEPTIATLDISTTSKCIEDLKDKIAEINKRLDRMDEKLNDK